MKTVEMKTLPKKNREKVSEMKTVEIPIFFLGGGGMDLTVFISETFSLRKPYHPLISQVSISKIYPLEGPIINGNL